VRPRHQGLHVRPGDVPQAAGQHVGHAEVEHPRCQLEAAVDLAHIAELGQGQQDPAGRGPGQLRGGGHRGERHDRLQRLEGPDHIEAARERLDEVGAGVAACHHGSCARLTGR